MRARLPLLAATGFLLACIDGPAEPPREDPERLLTDEAEYQAMASIANPYGRGNSGNEIADIIVRWAADKFGSSPRESWSAASNVA